MKFETLRAANCARLPQFKNKHGGLAHSKPDGSDWSPAQWLQAVVGELGEYANLRKKFERGDVDAATFKREAADELADVVTYLDILAYQLGIDLGAATADKFNRISKRVGSTVMIDPVEHKVIHRDQAFDAAYDANARARGQYDEADTRHGSAAQREGKQS